MLQNNFKRISLINKCVQEKVTIDFGIKSSYKNKHIAWPFLLVVEVKNNIKNKSFVFDIMKKQKVKERSFSKYAMGMITLNPDLKYNNLKETLLLLNKIKDINYA